MEIGKNSYDEMKTTKVIFVATILTSILLNHSNAQLGLNVSLSDIFVIMSIFSLVAYQKFILPKQHFLFFVLLSFILLIISTFYSPIKFNYNISTAGIIKDYIKLIVVFLFFLFGYNISRLDLMKVNIKWYSITAIFISWMGLLMKLFNVNFLNSVMYFSNTRFRGLMNDPNYYSVVQCTALVYFIRSNYISSFKKTILYLATFLFVAMSGSKTGMITFLIYSSIIFLEYIVYNINTYKSVFFIITSLVVIILIFPLILTQISMLLDKVSEFIPIFKRVQSLFEDFSSAVVAGGSGRDQTWKSGFGIIKASPLFGVGLGSYTTINNIIYRSGSVAHNTYLQILAEWGIVMGSIFFVYVFTLIFKSTCKRKKYKYNNIIFILRDILVILLIGSFAISLNNARMFWMFLGGFVFYAKKI